MTSNPVNDATLPRVLFSSDAPTIHTIPNREQLTAAAVKASIHPDGDDAAKEHAHGMLRKFLRTFQHINNTPISNSLTAIEILWDADDDTRQTVLEHLLLALNRANKCFAKEQQGASDDEAVEFQSMQCFCEALINATQELIAQEKGLPCATDRFQKAAERQGTHGALKSSLKKATRHDPGSLPSTLRHVQSTDRAVRTAENKGDVPAMKALLSLTVHGNELTNLQNALEGLAELIHSHDHVSRKGEDWQATAMERIKKPCRDLGVQDPSMQRFFIQFASKIEVLFDRCIQHHDRHPENKDSTVEYFKTEANDAFQVLLLQMNITPHSD